MSSAPPPQPPKKEQKPATPAASKPSTPSQSAPPAPMTAGSPPPPSASSAPNTTNSAGRSSETEKQCVSITSREQFSKLLTDVEHKPLLLEFFAVWCGACMVISSKLEELAKIYQGKMIVARVDVDDLEDLAIEYGVSMMPAFVVIKEKQVVEQFAGSNQEKLELIAKKYGGEPPTEKPASEQPPVATK